MNQVINNDSRRINELLAPEIMMQTTITSPPYFDMKDYGVEHQVGYGQNYEDYLRDIKDIFKQVYEHTKPDGTLWIVVDTFKRGGVVVPLPFDMAAQLNEVGWLLQDVIIWKKDKTVPWLNSGFMQRKFEYVLFFSKTSKFKANKDSVRTFDISHLKKWWVKYPERYNPKGKALNEIWEYPIPVQGSWGKEYIRHFCPLPKEMVANMIQISTDEGDVVFDPFAGTGAVLSQAAYMKRQYLGVELNNSFIEQFNTYIGKTLDSGRAEYEQFINTHDQDCFEQQIKNLRILKFGRVLCNKVNAILGTSLKVHVIKIGDGDGQKVATARYTFIGDVDSKHLQDVIINLTSKPPLSKFGVAFEIQCVNNIDKISRAAKEFCYSRTNTYSYMKHLTINQNDVVVISPICVDLNENDYDY